VDLAQQEQVVGHEDGSEFISRWRRVGSSPSGAAAEARHTEGEAEGLMLEVAIYVVFCILTGLCGMDRKMGFVGTFFFALVATPLVVLPVLFLTSPSRHAH
jgi:hypothetical protein